MCHDGESEADISYEQQLRIKHRLSHSKDFGRGPLWWNSNERALIYFLCSLLLYIFLRIFIFIQFFIVFFKLFSYIFFFSTSNFFLNFLLYFIFVFFSFIFPYIKKKRQISFISCIFHHNSTYFIILKSNKKLDLVEREVVPLKYYTVLVTYRFDFEATRRNHQFPNLLPSVPSLPQAPGLFALVCRLDEGISTTLGRVVPIQTDGRFEKMVRLLPSLPSSRFLTAWTPYQGWKNTSIDS